MLIRPFEPLASGLVQRIVDDAFELLERTGVVIHHREALGVLGDHGARLDEGTGRVFMTGAIVQRALESAPATVSLFDSGGRLTHEIGGDRQYFAPGSAARLVLDRVTGDAREPNTSDYVDYVKVVDGLRQVAAQSTAFIPADVPAAMSDSYRLYLSLLHSAKPVVTGTFSASGFAVMKDLQAIVRGGTDALASAPLAIFSCCPTSPLAWSADALATLIGCARCGIPVEVVPMPLAGFIAPVSLAGTLVQQTAESLAGIAVAQLVNPGAPVLFGCASTAFDIRHETTPMGSVESMLLACGSAQVGRHLGLPTQAYMALSDAKVVDAQAGLETSMGAALAGLAGINAVSGPGLLEFGNCFSLEKLVIDDEACAMASRLRDGIIEPACSPLAVVDELLREGHLLIADDTRRHLRTEITFPSAVIDRTSRARWLDEGHRTIVDRANARIGELLEHHQPHVLETGAKRALTERISAAARECGMEELPIPLCEP